MKKNFLIILDGPMGAGKTTIVNILSRTLKRTVVLSYDAQKSTITDFNEKDSEMIAVVRKSITAEYMKYRMNILLDGGFFKGAKMKPYISLAKRKGYKLFIYHLEAPTEIIRKRALEREHARVHAGKSKISARRISWYQAFHEKNRYRGKEVTAINSGELTPTQIVHRILKDTKTA